MTATPWCKTPSGARSLLAFLIALLLTLPAVAQTQTPIFPSPATSTTPVIAGMATGDFDGNGLPDTAYVSAPTITVLLNQGQGTAPIPVVTSGLTCTPQTQLVAADMNKDNKLDLVLTCGEGYVVVLLGNGDGTFQTPSYYIVTGVNDQISQVDLNGDGYPDIVVSAPQAGGNPSVVVLLNQGSGAPGTLTPAKNYPAVGYQPGRSFPQSLQETSTVTASRTSSPQVPYWKSSMVTGTAPCKLPYLFQLLDQRPALSLAPTSMGMALPTLHISHISQTQTPAMTHQRRRI